MIDLIRDQQAMTKNQIRKRTGAYIEQIQTHGDEQLLARVNDSIALNILPDSYDASGAESYRDAKYLPRALQAGALADQITADNERLKELLALQSAIAEYRRAVDVLESEYAPSAEIEDEAGGLVDNPAYAELIGQRVNALSVIDDASAEDWRLIAQRVAGAEIADSAELDLAVIGVLPTMVSLTAYVEGQGLGSIDGRMTLENARQKIIDDLTPALEVPPDEFV